FVCAVVRSVVGAPTYLRLSFFLFVLSRPPCSTLFPYTTLFRSVSMARTLARVRPAVDLHAHLAGGDAQRDELGLREELAGQVRLDRKSTRLNSSHLGISYAVFCLKKKKKKQTDKDTKRKPIQNP